MASKKKPTVRVTRKKAAKAPSSGPFVHIPKSIKSRRPSRVDASQVKKAVSAAAWSRAITDPEVRKTMSDMGAPCCPKGCIGKVYHLTAIVEVREVMPDAKDPNLCTVFNNPQRTEDVVDPTTKKTIPPQFLCAVCHHSWDVDQDLLRINWTR